MTILMKKSPRKRETKIKKNLLKRQVFSFNEIINKVKTIKLEYNTIFMIKSLDLVFKLSIRDFYDEKLINMEIPILQANKG